MRKCFVVMVAFLFVAAFSPRLAAADINFGVKGGLASSTVTWTGGGPSDYWESLSKPVIGAFFAFNLSPMLAVQPEVYYWIGGASIEETDGVDTLRLEMLFNYIHVPVLAKFRFGKGQLKPLLFAGPAVSFLTAAKNRIYLNGVLEEETDIEPFLNGTDFSAVFGTGLEYAISKITLILDVRYNMGFSDVDNKADETVVKNRAWMFMLGIGF